MHRKIEDGPYKIEKNRKGSEERRERAVQSQLTNRCRNSCTTTGDMRNVAPVSPPLFEFASAAESARCSVCRSSAVHSMSHIVRPTSSDRASSAETELLELPMTAEGYSVIHVGCLPVAIMLRRELISKLLGLRTPPLGATLSIRRRAPHSLCVPSSALRSQPPCGEVMWTPMSNASVHARAARAKFAHSWAAAAPGRARARRCAAQPPRLRQQRLPAALPPQAHRQ